MKIYRFWLSLGRLFLALSIAPGLVADVTGSILGVAKDSSGAVLPGVEVGAINLETNVHQSTRTDQTGEYHFLALPVGKYKIEAAKAGFQKFSETGIDLTVNDQHHADIVLMVGNVQEEVQVSGAALQVETTSSQVGSVIDSKQMVDLPLNGRSYIDLLGLQAGVAPVSSGAVTSKVVSGELAAGNVSVNGQREASNAFLVNGGDVSNGRTMGTAIIPNIDSVAEFRLITNSFDAEYGRFSGAIMNAITKSGSNGYHGAAFEFLRNDELDARNFFDPRRGAFKRNQFGYAVGGPILKDKLFWFTDYQGTREVLGISTGNLQVPSVAQRSGDFSAQPSAFLIAGQPATVNGPYWAQVLTSRLGYAVSSGEPYGFAGCTATTACVFPNNIIPSRGFAPTTNPLLKYIPVPNSGPNTLTSSGQNQVTRDDKAGQRIDVAGNRKSGSWFIYYVFDDSAVTSPLSGTSTPGFPTGTYDRAQQAVLSNIHVFGPTAVNEARVSFTRNSLVTNGAVNGNNVTLSSLGFVEGSGLGIFPVNDAVPRLSFNNFGTGPGGISGQPANTWALSDAFSKIVGKHSLKFGANWSYFQMNDRNVPGSATFSFNGSETGSDIADFLLGAPSQYVQSGAQALDSRTRYTGIFAQDSWRVTPSLTLNYGLRWEASMPWYDTQNRIETLIPGEQSVLFPTAPVGWLVPGDPHVPRTLAPTDYKEFGPRVGLAYSPGATDGILGKIFGGPGKTSVRASFGIFYTAIQDETLFDIVADAPYGQFWVSAAPPIMQTPFLTRSDGSSQGGNHFPFTFPTPGQAASLDYSQFLPIGGSPGYWYQNRQPYAEHYNLTLQRSLGSTTVLTLAYVGTEGHRLLTQVEANPGNAALCLSLRGSGVAPGTVQCGPNGENTTYTLPNGTKVFGTRGPFGNALTSDSYQINAGNSNYNSFQATLQKKAGNFSFLAAYTFSKSIDDASGYETPGAGDTRAQTNFSNYRLSRSLSAFNIPNNFVISYSYAIPFDKWMHSMPRRLVQGWSVTGITRFANGFPVTVSESGDRSLAGSAGTDVPNIVGPVVIQNPRSGGPKGPNEYFSSSSFAAGPLGAFGDSSNRFFSGPGFSNWDLSLHKNTTLREGMSLQFRAEFFNVFNHAQFLNPSGNFSSSLFGYVTGARAPRIGQVSLKFLF
jgi:Carboxypeptidase regulatory-like domain